MQVWNDVRIVHWLLKSELQIWKSLIIFSFALMYPPFYISLAIIIEAQNNKSLELLVDAWALIKQVGLIHPHIALKAVFPCWLMSVWCYLRCPEIPRQYWEDYCVFLGHYRVSQEVCCRTNDTKHLCVEKCIDTK